MKIPSIEEALAMNDEELAEFLGQPNQLKSFRQELSELGALKGDARTEAEQMWSDRFTPRVDSESLRWMKEDAIRHTQKPKEVLDSGEVTSIF